MSGNTIPISLPSTSAAAPLASRSRRQRLAHALVDIGRVAVRTSLSGDAFHPSKANILKVLKTILKIVLSLFPHMSIVMPTKLSLICKISEIDLM